MKKLIIITIICLFGGIVVVQSSVAQQKLNFATLDNFAPFTWSEGKQAKGIDVDILKELCKRVNVNCQISFMPWKRVMHYTQTGKTDGGFAGFKTPEREAFAHFLDLPFHYSKYQIFVKKGHEFPYTTTQDLYGKRLGKNRGFNLGKELVEATTAKKLFFDEARDASANISKLMKDRIQGYVGNYHEIRIALKKMGLSHQVVPLLKPIRKPRGAFLLISKNAKIANKTTLIDKMNLALKQMHEDGTINKISSKYLD
jgi:polar amino acid transport system substrate-binding protein